MEIHFEHNEMKNFILKGGKYKIVNVKCFSPVPSNWINGFRREEEEIEMEVAYQIDDIETEKWLFNGDYKRIDSLRMFSIESAFYREFKSKLLNL